MAVEVEGVQTLLLTKVYYTENRVPWSVCRVSKCLVGFLVGGTVGLVVGDAGGQADGQTEGRTE